MKCATCGTEAREAIRFCESCGADFSAAQSATEQQPDASTAPTVAVASSAPPVAVQQTLVGAWSQAALIGAIIISSSAFLPWVATPGASSDGFGVPFALIYDQSASSDGIPLGPFILGLGLVAIGLAFVGGVRWLQRIVGLVVLGATMAVVVQLLLSLNADDLGGELLGFLSLGVYASLFGGALVAFASK